MALVTSAWNTKTLHQLEYFGAWHSNCYVLCYSSDIVKDGKVWLNYEKNCC